MKIEVVPEYKSTLKRINGKWTGTNRNGEKLETNDFLTAYLFCRNCGYGDEAINNYQKLIEKEA